MKRRSILAATIAAPLALPNLARAQGTGVMKIVPHANLTSFDPIWTTAYITRNHGYMVYDTLYGMDSGQTPQPQMAAGHVIEEDGRSVTITLRDGLAFHDKEPVRAADAAASLRRWQKRSPYGQKLEAVTDEIVALDDKRLRFRLKKPFPLLFHALGSIGNGAFIMPSRIAETDPFKQIGDPTGSGPFRFKRDEFNSGSLAVYERNPGYVPRADGQPSLTAGPKRVFFDRIEWQIITDAGTAGAALQQGEIDWWENPTPELRPLLARNKDIVVEPLDPGGLVGIMRLNHLHPPFDNKALRRALLPAINQGDFMIAVVGTDPTDRRDGIGVFPPGTSSASPTGLEPLTAPRDVELAKRLMKEAGYTDQKMRLIGPTDIQVPAALTQVAADLFQRLGFNQDLALSDWGTVIQRRGNRENVEQGGWSALCTAFAVYDLIDPVMHPLARGNGAAGWPGWPAIPALEAARDAYIDAPDAAARQGLAANIQRIVMEEVAYVPLGWYRQFTAHRRNLTGRVSGFPLFWNLRRA